MCFVCVCRNVGSRWALEQAKSNLVNEYLLVGVTEELEDFIMMLEAALPRFFKGATELYRTGTPPLSQVPLSSPHRYPSPLLSGTQPLAAQLPGGLQRSPGSPVCSCREEVPPEEDHG